jgi:hypothetical protein
VTVSVELFAASFFSWCPLRRSRLITPCNPSSSSEELRLLFVLFHVAHRNSKLLPWGMRDAQQHGDRRIGKHAAIGPREQDREPVDWAQGRCRRRNVPLWVAVECVGVSYFGVVQAPVEHWHLGNAQLGYGE